MDTLKVAPPVQGSGLEMRSFLEGKGRNRRGNRSVDANTQRGDTVSLVLLPETNLSEGKGLLGPNERFGQTRVERAEELEALVKTGCGEQIQCGGPRRCSGPRGLEVSVFGARRLPTPAAQGPLNLLWA